MPTQPINFNEVTSVKFNWQDVTEVILNGQIIWEKPPSSGATTNNPESVDPPAFPKFMDMSSYIWPDVLETIHDPSSED